MRRSLFFFTVAFLFNTMVSCKKSFLDVVDNRELTRQGYVKDLNTLEEYLRGTYALFSQYILHARSEIYPELVADNLKPLASSPQFLMAQYTWSQQKTDALNGNSVGTNDLNMNAFWQSSYLVIRACNFVIENVDEYQKDDPGKGNQIKGEALSLRALLHFQLVNIFAQTFVFTSNSTHPGVPYITTSDLTKPFSRQTVAEVYDNMIADLREAVTLIPSSFSDTRRLNLMAAKAILARVYLFKGDFNSAKKNAKEVIKNCPLTLISDGYPDVIFTNKPGGTMEVLFQATPGDIVGSNFMGRFLSGENTYFLATNDIATLLQENKNDIRRKWVDSLPFGWGVKKFPINVAGLHSAPEADYYQPIVRSSEMFLTAAEACAKSGDDAEALLLLNEVRKRADPSLSPILVSGDALIDSIYKERRKELSFEGLRMFDLQRWRLGVFRKDALNTSWAQLPYPNSKAIAPIPMKDVNLAGLSQNDGY